MHGAHHKHHGSHGLGFVSPDQVQSKHQKVVMWEGRLGWVGKGNPLYRLTASIYACTQA